MERLLEELRGHLGTLVRIACYRCTNSPPVLYPTRFLEGEDIANNFLFNADRFAAILRKCCLARSHRRYF